MVELGAELIVCWLGIYFHCEHHNHAYFTTNASTSSFMCVIYVCEFNRFDLVLDLGEIKLISLIHFIYISNGFNIFSIYLTPLLLFLLLLVLLCYITNREAQTGVLIQSKNVS